MAIDIKIVIPSMGRADMVITKRCVKNATLCVPESEAAAYAEYNPGMPILTHPDSLKGLARKRQFILERCGNHYQIDDDIKYIQRLYVEKGEKVPMDADEAYDVIQYVGNMAKLAGCFLFGFSKQRNPLQYVDHKPIRLTGILNGSMGILEGSKLFFSEKAVVSEDYWICGLNAYYHRMLWCDERFAELGEKAFHNLGGCSNYRTIEQEKEDTLFLRQSFGEAIQMKHDTSLAKRKHPYQRTLKIPF